MMGQWSQTVTWPYQAVHATYFPATGTVFFWPSFAQGDNPQTYNPATGTVTATTPASYNFFCAGLSLLPDGQLFVTGGDLTTGSGVPNASSYDPVADAWTYYPNMSQARWYPTNTTLPNGDVLVTSGTISPSAGNAALPEVFQLASGSWRELTTAQLVQAEYPEMFLLPDGTVYYIGPEQQTRFINTSGTGAWTIGPVSNYGYRDYGPSVMYDTSKLLLIGGSDPPTATVEAIDLTSSTPSFQYIAPMNYPRRQANATLLPDGKVLVTGGSSGSGFDNANYPVYPAEMWDPATGNWTVMASLSIYRGYHSIAILLPDGSVLSAGGSFASAETFYPPYFFEGARPTITSAPTSVNPGATFFVATPDAANITAVNLIRITATTHTNNMEQRISHLAFSQATGGLNITAPANNNIVPPGYYMLFILNGDVPSIASMLQISASGQIGSPAIALSTKVLTFAAQALGYPATSNPVVLTNVSTSAVNLTNFVVQGAGFSLGANGCGSSLAPSATCTVNVAFQPTSRGALTGTLSISESDLSSPQIVALNGVGTALQVSGSNFSFGNVPIGKPSSATLPLTLKNVSTTPITVNSVTYSNPQFTESTANSTCGSTIAGGASCVIATSFTPASIGTQTGTLTIVDSDGGINTVTYTGSGTSFTITPSGLAFGNNVINTVSPSLSATLTNQDTVALTISSVVLGGANPSDFIIQSNTCGSQLLPGASCVVTLAFETAVLGAQSGTLTFNLIVESDTSVSSSLSMIGQGTPSLASITVTPANSSISSGATQQFTATGVYSDNSTNNITSSVNWYSSNTAVATVSTTTKGLMTAAAAGNTTITAEFNTVRGSTGLTVLGPVMSLSAANLWFGGEYTNATSLPLSVTAGDTGTGALAISNIALGGANASDFNIKSNTCGSQINAGNSCTVSLTFSPKAVGSRSATLAFTDNAGSGTQTVNLFGTGQPYLTSIAVSPANPTIPAGGTQQFTATGTYSDGSTNALTSSATWSSSNTNVAAVSTTPGLINTLASGTSTITATSSSLSGSTLLTVSTGGLTFSAANLWFGGEPTNASSSALSVTVSDGGPTAVAISSITLAGANPGDFSIQSSNCGSSLTNGTSCSVSLVFSPKALGSRSATLVFSDSSGSGTQTINLYGTGQPYLTSMTVTPSNPSVSAGSSQQFVATGVYSDSSTSTMTSSVNWYSSNATVATVSAITKGLVTGVNPGTSTITAQYNAINGNTTMTVPGPVISLSAANLWFGGETTNTTSLPLSLTVSNTGSAGAVFTSIALGGSNPGDFTIQSNSCGSQLAANSSCAIALTFTPKAVGSRSATVVLSDNAGTGAQTVNLYGTGQ